MQIFELFGSILINDNGSSNKLDDIDKKAGKTDGTFSKGIGTIAKWGAGLAVAGLAVAGLAVNVGEKLQKALNGLQSETGTADKSMQGMRESMLNIYNNNFGEDFEDIGTSMATVAKATGLTGKALESATTNALLLRDTFEMDVSGSVKATDQLMKQFGLTSEQAYNLVAQGAQQGMNKNDDLLDIISEYSVQFKTMGFSAEEMFNMLSNGAKAGGFSIDVLGDAVKEFNIRSKDGSDGTAKAFEGLGLNAKELTKAFGAGGADGKKAFTDVSEALGKCKDPILQNQIGTALWGTMWEDLGSKSILALGGTTGEINKAKDALEKLNAIKYNTFGEAMVGIKRNLETGILLPLSDKILPILGQFSTWVIANMPQIKETVNTAMTVIGNGFNAVGGFIKDNVLPIFVSLYEWIKPNIPAIKEIIKGAFDAMSEIFKVISDYIVNSLVPAYAKILEWIKPYMPAIKKIVVDAFTAIKDVFKVVNDFIVANVLPIFGKMKDWFIANFPLIKEAVQKAYDYIKPSFDKLVATIKSDVMPIIMGLWDTVKKAMPGIKAIFEIAMPLIVVAVKLAIDIITAIIKTVKEIYGYIKPPLDKVAELFSLIFGGIKKVIEGVQKAIEGVQKVLDFFNGTELKDKNTTVTTNYKNTGMPASFSNIGKNAAGTDNWRGGLTSINEVGGEIIDLPSGSRVIPHDVSMEMAKNANKTASYATSKAPVVLQLVLQNGKAIAEFIVDDLDNLMGSKNKITGRSVGV